MQEISSRLIGIDQGDELLFSDFEDDGEMWTGAGQRERRRKLKFSRAYQAPPAVFVALSMWDMDSGPNARAEVTAEEIDRKGCVIVFRTWGDSRVARARVRWMAIGPLPSDDDWDLS